ncbi:alpha/beta hydrolase [Rarobacter faecitabidus]|uniref:Pimeloyl-ACP methyl ester carboxylesterase n=1 Tax=Rarobacter faecitabidus TaxID=13243 RepID=A0A542ZTD4_RARFA|nr:alpha/beta hydrolase [Rarobacter faecitabidus]TQL63601.1 pimeloyl-ACP methyl ester carboxylesterase [Rarobacter faecitabidus]
MVADFSEVLIAGPWEHRYVAAGGSRFHVAVTGDEDSRAPLVLLLHSFPEVWWAWRHQLPALAEAGYRAAAIDLRGYGASDKPPMGYDMPNLCRDVAGIVRALGAQEATIVGHGLGGVIAWSMPTVVPSITKAVAAISAPHPARIHAAMRSLVTGPVLRALPGALMPGRLERKLKRSDFAAKVLREGAVMPWAPDELEVYRTAMRLPSVPHSSLEAIRWMFLNRSGATFRRYQATIRSAIRVPALQLSGRFDPFLDAKWATVDAAALCSTFRAEQILGAGHFPHEERPDEVNRILLDWLAEASPLPG